MTSAIDTNVLIRAAFPDAAGRAELERLLIIRASEPLLLCDVAYAELVPSFTNRAELDAFLNITNVAVAPIGADIAYEAGVRWNRYRRAGGPRRRVIADFLIGAHALLAADRLLTRDQGFFVTYFPELERG